jgi:aryl carrier-like protein
VGTPAQVCSITDSVRLLTVASGRRLEKSKCVIDLANLLNGPTTIAKQQTVNLLTYGVILKYENA